MVDVLGVDTGSARTGETFDMLALRYYGNEYLAPLLIRYNPSLADMVIFEENTEIVVPIIKESDATALPEWRRKE